MFHFMVKDVRRVKMAGARKLLAAGGMALARTLAAGLLRKAFDFLRKQ